MCDRIKKYSRFQVISKNLSEWIIKLHFVWTVKTCLKTKTCWLIPMTSPTAKRSPSSAEKDCYDFWEGKNQQGAKLVQEVTCFGSFEVLIQLFLNIILWFVSLVCWGLFLFGWNVVYVCYLYCLFFVLIVFGSLCFFSFAIFPKCHFDE